MNNQGKANLHGKKTKKSSDGQRDIVVQVSAEDGGCEAGETINLQGTAKMKANVIPRHPLSNRLMAEFSGTNAPHPAMKDARRIQPLHDARRRDSEAVCACPICTLKPKYQTRTSRAIAAIRHTARNARVWFCKFVERSGNFLASIFGICR